LFIKTSHQNTHHSWRPYIATKQPSLVVSYNVHEIKSILLIKATRVVCILVLPLPCSASLWFCRMLIYTVCSVIHADQHCPTRPLPRDGRVPIPRLSPYLPFSANEATTRPPPSPPHAATAPLPLPCVAVAPLPLHHVQRRRRPPPSPARPKPTQPYLSLIAPVNPT
jgi:hypothetical protein